MIANASLSSHKQKIILVAEDNEDDVVLLQRAFRQARLTHPIRVVEDGAEAIAYLQGERQFADRTQYPMPDLLLLDLKMPNKDGFEVMEWIRTQPALRHLFIVVVATSERVFDVQRAFQLGAAFFLIKPLELSDVIQLRPALEDTIDEPVSFAGVR